jgi:FAD/FMN-containing dehydrogenase
MTFVGDSQIEAVAGSELEKLRPADLGPFGQIVLSPLRRSTITSPLLRLPAEGLIFAFNFVRNPASNDRAEAERLIAANRAIYERVRAAGGALYPVSAFPMSGEDWRTHFGPERTQLDKAKHDFDPAHVLTPGCEIF